MIRFSGPVAAPHVHIATDDGDHGQGETLIGIWMIRQG